MKLSNQFQGHPPPTAMMNSEDSDPPFTPSEPYEDIDSPRSTTTWVEHIQWPG